MANVLIVAYLLIVLAMIAVILLQRSEGGALGIGGGSGGGLVSARGSANLLTRTTAVLAALFMATAISLTVLADLDRTNDRILDGAAGGEPGGRAVSDLLDAVLGDAQPGTSQPGTDQSNIDNDLPVPDIGSITLPNSDAQSSNPATTSADGPDLAIPSAPDPVTGN